MSVKVIVKGEQLEVNGKIVGVDEECRLPHDYARVLEDKGLCVIVAVGQPVEMVDPVQPDVEVKTPAAKKAVADAAAKKKRVTKKKAAKK
jgi:hypothetical protein